MLFDDVDEVQQKKRGTEKQTTNEWKQPRKIQEAKKERRKIGEEQQTKKKLVFKFGSIVRMLSFLSIDDDVD